MPKLTITLDEAELNLLEKRGEKNFLSVKEQVEDIVRRSCINYAKGTKTSGFKCDDKLVGIFSKDGRGRKKVRKK